MNKSLLQGKERSSLMFPLTSDNKRRMGTFKYCGLLKADTSPALH